MAEYATSLCYAAAIAQGISEGNENAAESYIEFLKLGCSDKPSRLLAAAGIDPLDEQTYKDALEFFKEKVDLYEQLIDAKLSNQVK